MRDITKQKWEKLLLEGSSYIERQEKQKIAQHIAKNIIKNEISARQKEILVLYYIEGKNLSEIAKLLGVHVSTVSRTRHRAFQIVQSRLRAYDLMI